MDMSVIGCEKLLVGARWSVAHVLSVTGPRKQSSHHVWPAIFQLKWVSIAQLPVNQVGMVTIMNVFSAVLCALWKISLDILYLKASQAFGVPIHSRALLAAILCWLATL